MRPMLVLQTEGRDAALKRLAHLALKAGVGVDDVPLEILVHRRSKLSSGPGCLASRDSAPPEFCSDRLPWFVRLFVYQLLLFSCSRSETAGSLNCLSAAVKCSIAASMPCPRTLSTSAEVAGENKHGDDHDDGGGLHFVARSASRPCASPARTSFRNSQPRRFGLGMTARSDTPLSRASVPRSAVC